MVQGQDDQEVDLSIDARNRGKTAYRFQVVGVTAIGLGDHSRLQLRGMVVQLGPSPRLLLLMTTRQLLGGYTSRCQLYQYRFDSDDR
jgi:hypothetical protein